jgi:hypothetical protein
MVQVVEAKAAGTNGRTFTGTVEARVQSNLGFRVAGKILERSVDVGQRVQKGQVLMRLDPQDLELALAAQQAKVVAARARYTQAKADEARFAGVVAYGGVSRQGYDAVRTELDISKLLLEAVRPRQESPATPASTPCCKLMQMEWIVRTLSEPGQVVVAGQTVIQLAHDGPREALINLPEGVRPDLGTTASARLYGQDQVHQARLAQLSDAADPASRTFEASFVLEGEAASAPLGSTVTVETAHQSRSPATAVRGARRGRNRSRERAGRLDREQQVGSELPHDPQLPRSGKEERRRLSRDRGRRESGGARARTFCTKDKLSVRRREGGGTMRGINLSALRCGNARSRCSSSSRRQCAGLLCLSAIGTSEDPSFTIKVLTVTAVWPGATAQEMQDLVAEPLEKRLQELRWYDRVETITRPGLALMTLQLLDKTPPKEVPRPVLPGAQETWR